ncbi:MAG: 2-oxoglutarate dehydrogenase E1 component [Planctomycetes bacterium]|nr:2-oxoglutarate dehydrogenase E1 component [Planctomycetota bacterium]
MPASDFASQWNVDHLDQLYEQWRRDPASVGADWQAFFAGFALGMEKLCTQTSVEPGTGSISAGERTPGRLDQQRADSLIYAYRDVGHFLCNLDPLGFNNQAHTPQLDLATHGLTDADLDREFSADTVTGMPAHATLRELVGYLRETYCGTIGIEYMHIQDREQRLWLRERIEPTRNQPQLTAAEKRRILMKLNQAEMLETFIHTKFLGQKRFSIEGGESLIPALDAIMELAPETGAKEIVMGMAHRGRLNVLCNILHKSHEEVFTEFEGSYDISELQGDGDVKYHLGYSSDYQTSTGKTLHMTLSANPSHLEAVDAVVEGRARAKQRQHGDTAERGKVVPLLIHGDAAFAGQGIVMEVFQMSQLEGYRTGGTIHIVGNNQIGFTTLPQDARSTRYCTDIAKMVDAPIFHVNGDDPEAVVHCAKMALLYRQRFKRDVVIDIVCYRRHGHNETDEPNYTQPTMYARIAEQPRVSKIYAQRLRERDEISKAEADEIVAMMQNQLQEALNKIKLKPAKLTRSRFKGVWTGLTNEYSHDPVQTGVKAETLDLIGKALSTWPTSFNIHPKVRRLAEERGKLIGARGRIDWATAELLAIGSLLVEGIPSRLSGQDSRRGTFSQRHSYWYDITSRERHKPLDNICPGQANFCVYNSPLSEEAVLGFDYGYSLNEPNMLIMWEAQFGDFVNGAQNIIDQFIVSSESKWGRVSGLVMLLPHGQEGMGPEHSSARLERFLQQCAEDNIQVANCTTAAQHFHILRRQMHRKFRKPLVLMTPKSHLRSKQASSSFSELVDGRFHEVIGDKDANPKQVKRLVITSGKVAHELIDRRNEERLDGVAIVRIEQYAPFPEKQLREAVASYKGADLVWCQEEPQNMGAWQFIQPYLRKVTGKDPEYAGRDAAASPAPGSAAVFMLDQEALVSAALGIPARKLAATKVGSAH